MEADDRALRLTLVAAVLGSGIVFLDSTVVNVALPAIREDLEAGLSTQQWVVEAYLLTLGSLLLVGGSLGDLYGRRRMFVLGLAGFGVTSLLCAAAPNGETLVIARGLQGIAGAMLVPGSLALITATFPADRRGAAIGAWTAYTGIAFVIGPLGGGALIDAFSWRWIFAINIPLVFVCLAIVRAGVPESVGDQTSRRVDVVGAVLCALGLAGPVFALIEQPVYGWGDPLVAIPLVIGIALLVAFVWWEGRSDRPMLPLAIFRARNFSVGNVTTLLVYGGLGAMMFFITVFLQQVSGYSAIAAGLALVPVTVVMFFLSRRFGALSQRIGPRLLMGIGPIVAGAGVGLLALIGAEVNYLTDVLPGLLVFSLGLSMTVAPLTATVLAAVPDHQAGVASGANNAIARVAGLLAIAAVGAVVASAFAGALDVRATTPAGQRALDKAKESALAGSIEAEGVPAAERARLDGAVEDASVDAFRIGMGLSGALVLLGGVISLIGIVNPARRDVVAAKPAIAVALEHCADGTPWPCDPEDRARTPAEAAVR